MLAGKSKPPMEGGRDEIICPAAVLKSAYGAIEKFEKNSILELCPISAASRT